MGHDIWAHITGGACEDSRVQLKQTKLQSQKLVGKLADNIMPIEEEWRYKATENLSNQTQAGEQTDIRARDVIPTQIHILSLLLALNNAIIGSGYAE